MHLLALERKHGPLETRKVKENDSPLKPLAALTEYHTLDGWLINNTNVFLTFGGWTFPSKDAGRCGAW